MRNALRAVGLSAAAALLATAAVAQERKLTLERLNTDPPLGGTLPTSLAWHPDGKRLTYLRHRSVDAAADLVATDAGSGREALLLSGDSVKNPTTGKPLPLDDYRWSPEGERLLVSAADDVFLVDAKTGSVRALTRTPEAEELALLSPDGRRVAFVRKNDLYVVDVQSGRETRLTKSGSDTLLNGRLDWVYEEELASRSARAFWWAPDSDAVAYLQLDQSRVPTFPIVDFLPVHNELKTQRYPKAGDPNAIVRVGVVGIAKDGAPGPERLTSFDPDDVYVLPDLAFTPDGRGLAFSWMNRAQSELQLRLLTVPVSPTAPLGAARTVVTERSETWLNAPPAPVFLKDGHRFLWLSERTGFAHLYLCELTGSCRAVTQGNWLVDAQPSFAGVGGAIQVAERTGFVYFVATEKDPRERHLYRARLDGTGRARLTKEDGTHRVLVSPDGRFYADTRSSLDAPPALVVSS
ncbi:MAG TPA: DPP IV N-terminal domain-containing protein, partial [Vicinamibacteria bacterium]|nr:DPP IV N-terminal domain-containing protein [Vicinamibacteria bacterium]